MVISIVPWFFNPRTTHCDQNGLSEFASGTDISISLNAKSSYRKARAEWERWVLLCATDRLHDENAWEKATGRRSNRQRNLLYL